MHLRKNNIAKNTDNASQLGDKTVDKANYVVPPVRDALWSRYTIGDQEAAARINGLLAVNTDYFPTRIDRLILSEEEENAEDPIKLRSNRMKRLFPQVHLTQCRYCQSHSHWTGWKWRSPHQTCACVQVQCRCPCGWQLELSAATATCSRWC